MIVVAAGASTRFGAPKQFLDLAGIRVLDRAVATAIAVATGVVVVIPNNDSLPHPPCALDPLVPDVALRFVHGAGTRSGSVRCGLAVVPDEAEIVVVHDAARPLASQRLYAAVIAAVRSGADAAVPVVDVIDTVRRVGYGTLDRNELVAVQTPQGFLASALRKAHRLAGEATDDTTLVEQAGGTVMLVHGERHNIKLTTPVDMTIAAALVDCCSLGGGHPDDVPTREG